MRLQCLPNRKDSNPSTTRLGEGVRRPYPEARPRGYINILLPRALSNLLRQGSASNSISYWLNTLISKPQPLHLQLHCQHTHARFALFLNHTDDHKQVGMGDYAEDWMQWLTPDALLAMPPLDGFQGDMSS